MLALFLGFKFGVTELTIGYFFTYIGVLSVVTRALFLGPLVDRFGEARLSRIGLALLATGLVGLGLAPNLVHAGDRRGAAAARAPHSPSPASRRCSRA